MTQKHTMTSRSDDVTGSGYPAVVMSESEAGRHGQSERDMQQHTTAMSLNDHNLRIHRAGSIDTQLNRSEHGAATAAAAAAAAAAAPAVTYTQRLRRQL